MINAKNDDVGRGMALNIFNKYTSSTSALNSNNCHPSLTSRSAATPVVKVLVTAGFEDRTLVPYHDGSSLIC